jgi:hypothetical protein
MKLVENRPAMRGGGDENGRLLVDETLTEKAGHCGVQGFLVVVELNRVVLMSFVHGLLFACRIDTALNRVSQVRGNARGGV